MVMETLHLIANNLALLAPQPNAAAKTAVKVKSWGAAQDCGPLKNNLLSVILTRVTSLRYSTCMCCP